MARRPPVWIILTALAILLAGCITLSDAGDEAESEDPNEAETPVQGEGQPHAPPQDSGAPGKASVTILLGLTEDSRIALKLQAVDVGLDREEVRVDLVHSRLMPGEDSFVARLTAPEGTRVADTQLSVSFFDGLGRANFTAQIGGFRFDDDAEQTIVLRNQGPSEIGYVTARGPLNVEPQADHAVPQYGYILWPDGNRRALPGFDHVVHVPTDYPNIQAGQQASFLVEAPDESDVLWRHEEDAPHRGATFSFTPDPGRHHIRLSVGPGDSTTSLSIHTDYQTVVNGTVAAGSPGQVPTAEPVNGAEHTVGIEDDAIRLTLVLEPLEPEHALEDLDLRVLDGDGRLIAESSSENETRETIGVSHPQPGNYTIEITSDDGVAQDYSLRTRVNY